MRSRPPLTKSAWWYLLWIGRNKFFLRKNVTEFPTLHHLPSGGDILMTIALNLTKLEPIGTRHPYLFRDINFEENGARKGLKTAVWKSDQKLGKRQNRQTWCTSGRLCDGILQHHHIASNIFGLPINTAPFFFYKKIYRVFRGEK